MDNESLKWTDQEHAQHERVLNKLNEYPLMDRHVEDLGRSGITYEQALEAGFRSVTDEEDLKRYLK